MVKNGRLFAQRRHSAWCAPLLPKNKKARTRKRGWDVCALCSSSNSAHLNSGAQHTEALIHAEKGVTWSLSMHWSGHAARPLGSSSISGVHSESHECVPQMDARRRPAACSKSVMGRNLRTVSLACSRSRSRSRGSRRDSFVAVASLRCRQVLHGGTAAWMIFQHSTPLPHAGLPLPSLRRLYLFPVRKTFRGRHRQ